MSLNWFNDIILKDWKIKLICLFLSLALWLFVRSMKISTLKINVPLKITGLSENLIYFKEPPRFANVVIQGKKEYLNFTTSDLKARIILKNAKLGRNSYKVSFDERQLPTNVKLVSVSKEYLTLERKVEKQLIVRVSLKGKVLSGHKLGMVSATPPKLRVKGPLSRISRLYQISTKSVDISAKDTDIERTVEIENLPPLVKSVDTSKVKVLVKIFKAEMQNEIILDDIEIIILNLGKPARFEIDPLTVQATIQGPKNLLGLVQKDDLNVFVDLIDSNLALEELSKVNGSSEINKTNFNIPVQFKMLRFQKKLTVVKVTPPQVRVKLKKDSLKSPTNAVQKQESKDSVPSPQPDL